MRRMLGPCCALLLVAGCVTQPPDETAAIDPQPVGPAPVHAADLTPVQPVALQPAVAPAPATPSVRFYRVLDPFRAEGLGRQIKGTSSQVHLLGEPFLDESGIASAKALPNPHSAAADAYLVQVWFTDAGTQAISAVTSAHPDEQIAIEVNGEVVAAPQIRGTIRGSAYIAGEFTREQAEALASGLGRAAAQKNGR